MVLAAMAVCATAHVRRPTETAWEDMSPTQLSWAAEGITERISELTDDLARVQRLQAQKMEQEQK